MTSNQTDRSLVLVVDDDPAILPLVEAILDEDPVVLEGVANGPEALTRLADGLLPDLVLLDVMMPGMGGLDVLRRVKERLRVLVETTGGIAHALNQPLTAAILKTETLLGRGGLPEGLENDLGFVLRALEKVAAEVRRIQHITRYRTTEYLAGVDILDLEGDE